jgi:hypothetical protein
MLFFLLTINQSIPVYCMTEAIEQEQECPCCLEQLFQKGKETLTLACNKKHSFHMGCLFEYYYQIATNEDQPAKKRKIACPLCRADICSNPDKKDAQATRVFDLLNERQFNKVEDLIDLDGKTTQTDGAKKCSLCTNDAFITGRETLTLSCNPEHSFHIFCLLRHHQEGAGDDHHKCPDPDCGASLYSPDDVIGGTTRVCDLLRITGAKPTSRLLDPVAAPHQTRNRNRTMKARILSALCCKGVEVND